MFGVKFSSSTSSSNWPPELAASTVSPPNSCSPSNANRKLQHYRLTDKLNNVLASIQQGLNKQAINQLNAFIHSIDAWRKTGQISGPAADTLIAAANAIIALLS